MGREGCVKTEEATSYGLRGEGCHDCCSTLLSMEQMAIEHV